MKPETVPLGEACVVVMGQSPPGTSYNTSGDGLPFFQGKTDFGDLYPKVRVFCNQPSRIAEHGDILMSVRAPVGPTNLAKGKCCIGRGLAALRPRNKLEANFLLYFLRHHEPRLASQGQGSTFDAINRDDLEDIEIPLPELSEQRQIAARLEQADRLRRTRRYAVDLTDTFLPAAFIALFGDARANTKKWDNVTLGELIVRGPQNGLYKPASAYGTGTPILRIDAFYDGAVTDIDSLKRVRLERDEIECFGLSEDDIVVNRVNSRPYLGKCALIPRLKEPTVFESNMMRFSVNREVVGPVYLTQYLQTPFVNSQIQVMAKDAVNQSSVNQEDVKGLVVRLPPSALQQKFAAVVEQVERLRAVQREAMRQAEHLFASLLHCAFSG